MIWKLLPTCYQRRVDKLICFPKTKFVAKLIWSGASIFSEYLKIKRGFVVLRIPPRNVSSNAPHIAPDSPSSSEAEGREVSCGAEFNHQQGMVMTCEWKKSCNSWEIMG